MSQGQRLNGDSASISAGLAGALDTSRFGLTETEIGDGCREIVVRGELDLAVADQLEKAIRDCRGEQILISLESCRFIDSTGIAMIVKAHRRNDPRVVVHSPRDQVLRVLEVTGLTGNGLVFDNREQALSVTAGPVGAAG